MKSLFKLDQLMCALRGNQKIDIFSKGIELFKGTANEYFTSYTVLDKCKWYVMSIEVTDDNELKVLITERCEI